MHTSSKFPHLGMLAILSLAPVIVSQDAIAQVPAIPTPAHVIVVMEENHGYSQIIGAWVIPNLNDDMHDGTIQQGDSWLQTNLLNYVTWAQNNNSLLIVQFDEDQGTTSNHIATIFVGPMVKPGNYGEKINHYNVLRTIEDMYGLPHLGKTTTAAPITDVWK
jgi:hypothetical protein